MKVGKFLWFSFFTLFFVITSLGTYYFFQLYDSYVDNARHLLDINKTNVIRSIDKWIEGRENEIEFLCKSEISSKLLEGIITRSNGESTNNFSKLIKPIIEHQHYYNFFVANKEGGILYAFNLFDSSTSSFVKTTLNKYIPNLENDTTLWLINLDRSKNRAFLCALNRILSFEDKTKPPLLFVSLFNFESTLLPLIKLITSEHKSFEIFMALQDKDSVFPVTPLRFKKINIGEIRFSIKEKTKPMVQTALGFVGFGEGIDYRDKKVFFFSDKVPQIINANIVAKVDKEEALGNFNIILLLAGIIHIMFFGSFALLIKYYIKKDEEQQLLAEVELNRQKYLATKKYELLTQNANDLIIIYRSTGEIVESNKKAEDVLGYTTEEIKNLYFNDIFSEEDTVQQDTPSETHHLQRRIFEAKAKRKDGSVFFAEVSESLVEYEGNEVILAIIHDVTEQKVTVEKIKKLNQTLLMLSLIDQTVARNTELTELFTEICRIITEFGKFKMAVLLRYFEDVNEFVMVTHSGVDSFALFKEEFTYDECVQEYPFLVIDVESIIFSGSGTVVYYNNLIDKFDFPEHIRKVLLSKQLLSVVIIPIISFNELFGVVVVFSDNPFFFESEEVHIFEEMSKDFSFAIERYFQEQKYFESEFKRNLFFDSAPNIFLLTDIEGNIIDANRTFWEIFGADSEKAYGMKIFEILPDGVCREFEEKFSRIFKTNAYQFDFKVEGTEGKTKWFLANGSFIPEYNFVFFVISDLTEIYEMEQQLREEKNRAELADEVKTNILNNISHEFRTPISNILGFSKLLRESYHDNDLKEMGDLIYLSGFRLFNVLESLIYVSRFVGGVVTPTFEEVDLTYFFQGIKDRFEPFASMKNLFFELEISNNLGRVETDTELLSLLMFCLIDNAIKYTHQGGITIVFERVDNGEVGNWVIKVIDTGVGIPKDKINEIFELFRQGSEGVAREYEGLGIGLFLVRKIAELLGGVVSLESEVDKGTTFFVTLPIKQRFDYHFIN
jgi:PAS domain S-box-containing protein